MLYSMALIFIIGLLLSQLFQRFHLPSLLGMILTGILLGPFVLALIAPSLLAISADLRQMALIVILIRAGLTLNFEDLAQAEPYSALATAMFRQLKEYQYLLEQQYELTESPKAVIWTPALLATTVFFVCSYSRFHPKGVHLHVSHCA